MILMMQPRKSLRRLRDKDVRKQITATILALGSLIIATPSFAQKTVQDAAKQVDAIKKNNIPTDIIFNRICYAQVPNVEDIRKMAAKLGWLVLNNEDLTPFRSQDNLTSVEAWDSQVGERVYRIGLTQGPMSAPLQELFPDFGSGTATSCSLVLDGLDDTDDLYMQMAELAGKEPTSKDVFDQGFLSTSWAGGNDAVKVFLVMKTDAEQAGDLLNVLVLNK